MIRYCPHLKCISTSVQYSTLLNIGKELYGIDKNCVTGSYSKRYVFASLAKLSVLDANWV